MPPHNAPNTLEESRVEADRVDHLLVAEALHEFGARHAQHVHVEVALDALVQGDVAQEVVGAVLVLDDRLRAFAKPVRSPHQRHDDVVVQDEVLGQRAIVAQDEIRPTSQAIAGLVLDAEATPRVVGVWLGQTERARAAVPPRLAAPHLREVGGRWRAHTIDEAMEKTGDFRHGHTCERHVSNGSPGGYIYFVPS